MYDGGNNSNLFGGGNGGISQMINIRNNNLNNNNSFNANSGNKGAGGNLNFLI